MIAPLIVIGAPLIASLIMQYVLIPIYGHYFDLKAKGREWIFGWYVIFFVVYLIGAPIWSGITHSTAEAKEKARKLQVIHEVEDDYARHYVTTPDGLVMYRP